MDSKKRRLKVYLKPLRRECNPYAFCPQIRLTGKWLTDFGFNHGDKIEVSGKDGKLTITRID